jgi:hypothetical protein
VNINERYPSLGKGGYGWKNNIVIHLNEVESKGWRGFKRLKCGLVALRSEQKKCSDSIKGQKLLEQLNKHHVLSEGSVGLFHGVR